MSVLTIQIRGLNMTRRRNGEELSDPVSEVEDGDGDAQVVVAHFDARHVRLLPADSVFSLGDRAESATHADGLAIGMGIATALGSDLAQTDDDEDPEDRGRRSPAERLRAKLRARGEEGPQAWLEELARAARDSAEAIELFTARKVPGAWLRVRLRAHGDRVELRATLRPAPERSASSTTPLLVRAPGHVPGLVVEVRAGLEPDGRLTDIQACAASDALPEIPPDLRAALKALDRAPPAALAAGLEALSQRHPTATAQLVALRLEALETLDLHPRNSEAGTAPTFGELIAEDAEATTSGRLCFWWSDDGRPVLERVASIASGSALDRDLSRLERLAAILSIELEEEDAA